MDVIIKGPNKVSLVASDIECGTTFSGTISGVDSVFLMHAAGIVDLKDPYNTWSHQYFEFDDLPVENFVEYNATLNLEVR